MSFYPGGGETKTYKILNYSEILLTNCANTASDWIHTLLCSEWRLANLKVKASCFISGGVARVRVA